MSPKRKSKASIKQDQPDKKVHLLKNENLDTNHKDGFGDKNKAGKEFNFTMKQENNDSIPKKKYGHQELSDIDQKPDEAEFSSLELNQLLQQKSKLSLQGLVCWKPSYFQKLHKLGLSPMSLYPTLAWIWLKKKLKEQFGLIKQVFGKTLFNLFLSLPNVVELVQASIKSSLVCWQAL